MSFSDISVNIPNVPSLPISSLVISYPATSLSVGLPVWITVFGSITYSLVTPYLTHLGPPAFSATFPPRVQNL